MKKILMLALAATAIAAPMADAKDLHKKKPVHYNQHVQHHPKGQHYPKGGVPIADPITQATIMAIADITITGPVIATARTVSGIRQRLSPLAPSSAAH